MNMNRVLICCFLAVFLIAGCGGEPPAPPKPKVVRKKITARPPSQTVAVINSKAEDADGTQKPVGDAQQIPGTPVDSSSVEGKIAVQAVGSEPGKPVSEIAVRAVEPLSKEPGKPVSAGAEEKAEPSKAMAKATDSIQQDGDKKPDDAKKDNKAESSGTAAPLPKGDTDKYVAYNQAGRIDPFEPLFKEEPKAPAPKPVALKSEAPPRQLTPLERMDLSQLKLVGIVRVGGGSKALVEEASGKGYIITKGTFIGIHSGKVVDILPDRIVVEEKDEDIYGNVTILKRELKFQRPSGEELL